eukprot:6773248-Prymnesium_polylepis.1
MSGTAREDGKSGPRGSRFGTKRPLGRCIDPTESTLRCTSRRACPLPRVQLRESLPPHTGIDGNAWGTAPGPEKPQRLAITEHNKHGGSNQHLRYDICVETWRALAPAHLPASFLEPRRASTDDPPRTPSALGLHNVTTYLSAQDSKKAAGWIWMMSSCESL